MGDRAMCHIQIGGTLSAERLDYLAALIATYDLRSEWSGDDFDLAAHPGDGPLDLYGEDLNGGLVPDLETFCKMNALPFWRWSGGCFGAFNPELYAWYGAGDEHWIDADDDERPVIAADAVKQAETLDALKDKLRNFEREMIPFTIQAARITLDEETRAYLAEARTRALTGFPLSEVTEEFYFAQLNCLPPADKCGALGFFVSEAYTDGVHAQFVEYRGKFYGAYVDINDPATLITDHRLSSHAHYHAAAEPLGWYPDFSKAENAAA